MLNSGRCYRRSKHVAFDKENVHKRFSRVLRPGGRSRAHFLPFRGPHFPLMVDSLGIQRRKTTVDIPEDPRERKRWMMQLLQQYGQEFLIFEPEDQANVFAAPEPEYRNLRSGKPGPL